MQKIQNEKVREIALAAFKKMVYSLNVPPEEEWDFYRSQMTLWKYEKGEFFMRPGDASGVYAYIHQGIFKRYYLNPEGNPIVFSFDGPGRAISDLPALLKGVPAQLHIECLKDSFILKTPINFHTVIRNRHVAWQENGRRITELRYLEFVDRTLDLLSLKAKDRYLKFLKIHESIQHELDQKDIAAYIGVTPTSLSRIIRSVAN